MTTIHLAVIEYGSDFGDQSPVVVLAKSEYKMHEALLDRFQRFYEQAQNDWVKEHPVTDLTPQAFGEWYAEYHGGNDELWINWLGSLEIDDITESFKDSGYLTLY